MQETARRRDRSVLAEEFPFSLANWRDLVNTNWIAGEKIYDGALLRIAVEVSKWI